MTTGSAIRHFTLDPDGGQTFLGGWGDDWHVVFEDPPEDVLAEFAVKLEAGSGQPEDMVAAAGPRLQFRTSVCSAGPDLRTVYVGSLAMQRLPTFRSPVPGLPMSHWR
jgi:gluconolactonase